MFRSSYVRSPMKLSSGLLLGKFQRADHLRTHRELLYLPRDSHRQFAHKADVLGHLVMGDLPTAEVADLVLRRALVLAENDPCAQFLTVLLVGHTENLHILYFWMSEQVLLDLAGINVLTPSNNHVLEPAHDVAIAVGVDCCKIACMHPPINDGFACLLFVFPVARHHRVSSRAEFSGFADRYRVARGIDYLYLQMRLYASHCCRALVQRIGRPALERHRTGLRHAV